MDIQGVTQPESEVVVVTDIQEFGDLVVGWHTQNVDLLVHTLHMPADVGIQITIGHTEDTPEVSSVPITRMLDVSEHEAFKAGINFALECLGTLPFGVSYGEASDSESRSEPT